MTKAGGSYHHPDMALQRQILCPLISLMQGKKEAQGIDIPAILGHAHIVKGKVTATMQAAADQSVFPICDVSVPTVIANEIDIKFHYWAGCTDNTRGMHTPVNLDMYILHQFMPENLC